MTQPNHAALFQPITVRGIAFASRTVMGSMHTGLEAHPSRGGGQEHHAPIRRQPATIESCCDLPACDGWKSEGKGSYRRSWRMWLAEMARIGSVSATKSYAISYPYAPSANPKRGPS